MLVLSRQRDETIMIGDEVEVTVVDIRGDKVRLGITAPTRIAVHRKEVYEAIKTENERSARLADADLPTKPGEARSGASRLTSTITSTVHKSPQPNPGADQSETGEERRSA